MLEKSACGFENSKLDDYLMLQIRADARRIKSLKLKGEVISLIS